MAPKKKKWTRAQGLIAPKQKPHKCNECNEYVLTFSCGSPLETNYVIHNDLSEIEASLCSQIYTGIKHASQFYELVSFDEAIKRIKEGE